MPAKEKLRTSEDVLHRLQWDASYDLAAVRLGYDDRIVGPMEMPAAKFRPVSEGGDLPYHRISYFRTADRLLWDRLARLDRVFGSGDTERVERTPALLEPTRRNVAPACANVQQALEEQARLEERKRAQRPSGKGPKVVDVEVRPCAAEFYPRGELRVLTWNILFDLFDYGQDAAATQRRRAVFLRSLRQADCDVVCLQEVTPDLAAWLLEETKDTPRG